MKVEWDNKITLEQFRQLYYTDASIILVWGNRDSGKSFAIPQVLTKKAIQNNTFRCMLIRKQLNTVKASIFDRFDKFWTDKKLDSLLITKTKQPIEAKFINGSDFLGRGCDNAANIKSTTDPSDAFIDEADQITEDEFDVILTTLRNNKTKVQCWLAFNPEVEIKSKYGVNNHWIKERFFKGMTDAEMYSPFNEFYIDVKLEDEIVRIKCLSMHVTHDDNPYADKNRIAIYESYKNIDYNKYLVWRLGHWGRRDYSAVYSNYDANLNHSDIEATDKDALHIGMDFNVEHMAAIVHVNVRGQLIAVDEFIDYYDTDAVCRAIEQRYPNNQKIVYPDSSGKNRHSSGETDVKILKKYKFKIMALSQNPLVRDRVQCFNNQLKDKDKPYLVNKNKCPLYSNALESIAYDKNYEPDKKTGLDHATDAGGYCVWYTYGKKKNIIYL